jgi:hypothetical protein
MKIKQIKYSQKSIFQLALVLLLVFLFSVSVSALHHHTDGFPHDNCPLCIAGNHVYVSYQNYSPGNVSLAVADMDLLQEPLFYGSVYVTHISLRAPPA